MGCIDKNNDLRPLVQIVVFNLTDLVSQTFLFVVRLAAVGIPGACLARIQLEGLQMVREYMSNSIGL